MSSDRTKQILSVDDNIYIYKDCCCRYKERIRIYFKIRRSTKRFVFFEYTYFVFTYVLYICMFPACCFCQRTYLAQGLCNRVLNETWTHSGFKYKWPLVSEAGLYRVVVPLSWSVFTLVGLYIYIYIYKIEYIYISKIEFLIA